MQTRTTPPLWQGAVGGLLAGTLIALWFLVVDGLNGEPLATPILLARALFDPGIAHATVGVLVGYTLLHLGTFAALGIATAAGLTLLGMEPRLRYGFVFGLGVLNAVHYGALLTTGTLATLPAIHVLAANLVGGMALMYYLHHAQGLKTPLGLAALRDHRLLSEGLKVGTAGAVTVGVWFLLLDVIGGRPFFTPAALGSLLFLGTDTATGVQITPGLVAGYTVFHLGAFALVGTALVWISERVEQAPGMWLGALMVLIVCEVGFIGVAGLLGAWVLGSLGWWAIGVGNVLAVAIMGHIVWRTHPVLRRRLTEEPVATMV